MEFTTPTTTTGTSRTSRATTCSTRAGTTSPVPQAVLHAWPTPAPSNPTLRSRPAARGHRPRHRLRQRGCALHPRGALRRVRGHLHMQYRDGRRPSGSATSQRGLPHPGRGQPRAQPHGVRRRPTTWPDHRIRIGGRGAQRWVKAAPLRRRRRARAVLMAPQPAPRVCSSPWPQQRAPDRLESGQRRAAPRRCTGRRTCPARSTAASRSCWPTATCCGCGRSGGRGVRSQRRDAATGTWAPPREVLRRKNLSCGRVDARTANGAVALVVLCDRYGYSDRPGADLLPGAVVRRRRHVVVVHRSRARPTRSPASRPTGERRLAADDGYVTRTATGFTAHALDTPGLEYTATATITDTAQVSYLYGTSPTTAAAP